MNPSPGSRPARLRLRVSPAAENALRKGHPWVFADNIRETNRPGATGELAIIYDRQDRFLAAGWYDAESPIAFRALQLRQPRTIDEGWWDERLETACQKRAGLFKKETTGYRWINGESDGWPGLVLDRYGETLVVKLYTASWLPHAADLTRRFMAKFGPERLVLRLSRNIQEAARGRGLVDGSVLAGEALDGPVVFLEDGLRFEADPLRGQKTGFFLDQRENRARVGELARGRRVLNTFSFSGGFSLYAARGEAAQVTDVDISQHAIAAAARNFALNTDQPAVAACRRQAVQADVFEWLNQCREEFDLVILDPPSLARREVERAGAVRAYQALTSEGIRHAAPGGVVLVCSCSAHVSTLEFSDAVRQAVTRSGRKFQWELRGHAPDHPATIPEAQYLKAVYLRLD